MIFGPVPVADAFGATLAHGVPVPGGRLKKGHVLTRADLARLSEAGLSQVTVARLEPGDVAENDAALRLAEALVPEPEKAGLQLDAPFTGRVNIRATGPGILSIDEGAIRALNGVDPMITLATLLPLQRVVAGMMVGTVKIIAYAVPDAALALACAAGAGGLGRLAPVLHTADLIITAIPGAAPGAAEKGIAAVWERIDRLGMARGALRIVPHTTADVATALRDARGDLVLVLTGSATSDIADVVPAGLIAAGGTVARFGMPVDPGNLLVLGAMGRRPVIGLPGCARSPALNGADWVLERIACGLTVSSDAIAAMGVGGLLKEVPTRPQPRERR